MLRGAFFVILVNNTEHILPKPSLTKGYLILMLFLFVEHLVIFRELGIQV